MKLKTISFSVIKQIIAHQDCWAQSSSLSEGLLLLLGPAPRGQEGGGWSREEAQGRGGWVGGFRGRHPKEGWGRRWEEINVPLRSETALYPPQHPAPLSREKVHDQAPGPWLFWADLLTHPLASEQDEEAPPPSSGTCSWGGGMGTGKGDPEKVRNLPDLTQQIN